MMEMSSEFPNVVQLNVGGKLMAAKLSTLVKDPKSMLTEVFTGRIAVEKDSDGRYFIDCNGDTFAHILEFLRFGILPKQENAVELYRYAKIFKIQALVDSLENFFPIKYENRMKKVLENFGDTRVDYEEFRNKVLTNIGHVNCHDNTLIPIVYILNDEACGKDHSLMVSSQLLNLGDVNTLKGQADNCIPMQTLYINDASEISRYLAHELCKLGYCKQGFFFDALKAQNCRNRANCGFTWKLEFIFLSRSIDVEGVKILKRP